MMLAIIGPIRSFGSSIRRDLINPRPFIIRTVTTGITNNIAIVMMAVTEASWSPLNEKEYRSIKYPVHNKARNSTSG